MSKPSETASLRVVPAGEILAPIVEPTPVEVLRAEWQSSISRGGDILLLPPRKWLVGEWLPLNALGIIYAEAGTGKSFYALSLALELARGGAWCGTQLKEPLEVLYVAGERINDLRDRAEAWSRHYEAELPAALSFMHPLSTPQLTKETQLEALCQEVRARGARVVVIDTYARATLGLNENDSGESGVIAQSLDRVREATQGGLVLVVHHTNKTGASGMNSIRGSSALAGAADIAIQLDKKERGIEAKVTMSNAGQEPEPVFYKLEAVTLRASDDGWVRSSAVMVEASAAPYRKQTDKILVEILEGFDLADGFARVDTERVLGVGRSRAGALLKELTEAGLLTNTSPATGLLNTAKYFLTEKGRARAEELESLEVARKKREGS